VVSTLTSRAHSREGCCKAAAIRNAPSGDNHDRLASQWTTGVFAEVNDSGNEDREWGIACMATTFTALRTYDVNAWYMNELF
jgi:hypothetical protein